MKEVIAIILIYVGAFVTNIAFWVWLVSLLIWKIFAVVGASTVIYPSFYTMIGGVISIIVGFLLGAKEISKTWSK